MTLLFLFANPEEDWVRPSQRSQKKLPFLIFFQLLGIDPVP